MNAEQKAQSTSVLTAIQAAIVVIGIATIVLSFWLTNHVTMRAILRPVGAYTIPYNARGGTVFINQAEHIELLLRWFVTAALLGTQLWLNRARRRPEI